MYWGKCIGFHVQLREIKRGVEYSHGRGASSRRQSGRCRQAAADRVHRLCPALTHTGRQAAEDLGPPTLADVGRRTTHTVDRWIHVCIIHSLLASS
jgi:hypothetical protein